MQVNVKELTGVLHLKPCIYDCSCIAEFLSCVFSSVLSSPSSKLTPSTSQVCQAFPAPSVFSTSRVLSVMTPLPSRLF